MVRACAGVGYLGDGAVIEARIREALATRKAKLDTCPIRKAAFFQKECPNCHATSSGPCWVNVEADAAFVDAIKEMIA